MRSPRFPVAAATFALLFAGGAPAPAQEDAPAEAGERIADELAERLSGEIADRLADRIAEKVADKLADRLADRLADGLEDRLAERLMAGLGGEEEPPADLNSEEGIRYRINQLVKQAEPAGQREAIADFMKNQWPAGEPLADHAAELAGVLGFLARQLPEEAGYEAFALAGDLAERALEAGGVSDEAKESFGMVFYNAACAHALADEPERALADLDRAFEYGFGDIDLLKEDADLDSLRDRPGFADRLEDWERAAREAAIAEAKQALAEGETFPLEFTYTDTDGDERSLSDYAGKVVIVDFWGTWCPPCVAEVPSFVKLQDQYGPDGLQILGLNYGDEPEEIEEFAAENGMNYPTGLGEEETREMVPEFRGYPTTVFVGRDGKVRMRAVGLHDYAFLEAVVAELLAEPAPKAKPKKKPKADADADA